MRVEIDLDGDERAIMRLLKGATAALAP